MKLEIIGKQRKDGKFKVKTFYKGAPNMFGGFDHGKCYTSIMTIETINNYLNSCSFESAVNIEQLQTTTNEVN
jgi:hypothetical protein|tara:strand:- start:7 stop:225 length:219 start_codon:yes stop_codon:yes gene_type:complete